MSANQRKPTPLHKFRVMDTVTYERIFYVYAVDEDNALDLVADDPAKYLASEEQTGNTPWVADNMDEEGPYV